jgi:hypothetical protein
MVKTMSLQAITAMAARLAAKKGEGRLVVEVRPPYVPEEIKRGEYDSPFGRVKVEGIWLDYERGVWKVRLRFLGFQNPVIPSNVGEELLKKLNKT